MMLVNVIKWKVKVLRSPGEDLDDNDGECHKMKSESSLVTRWRAHAMYCPPNASCPECPFVLIICLFHHQHYQHHHQPSSNHPECQFVLFFCSLKSSHTYLIFVEIALLNKCRACHMQCTFETYHCRCHLEPGQDCFITPLGGIRGGPQLRGGPI